MVKVTNHTARTVKLHNWKVLPNGSSLLDPSGERRELMPEEVAYSRAAKVLADSGVLGVDGYHPVKVEPKAELKTTVWTMSLPERPTKPKKGKKED